MKRRDFLQQSARLWKKVNMLLRVFFLLVMAGIALQSADGAADGWPAYGHDAARSGVTSAEIEVPLHSQWVYSPRHAPQPAWPEPGKELHRMDFDYAYQVAVAKGVVYFESSADNKVYALDAETGTERWSFFTGGPVRFAPAVWNDRAFVASDDGWLYCLSAAEGRLIWKFRGAPRADKLLGNGRMISRWPLRGGVLVDKGTVYVAAGMWPAEGVYVYALRAEDGAVIWKNDTSGNMFRVGPHGGETISGVAPQGYLLASEDTLFVPTGRSIPAAFDRKSGRFLYYRALANAKGSGWWARVSGNRLFCRATAGVGVGGVRSWDGRTGYVNSKFLLTGKQHVVVGGETLYALGSGRVSAFDLKDFLDDEEWSPPNVPFGEFDGRSTGYEAYQFIDRTPPKPGTGAKWEAPCNAAYELILAGTTLFAGGQGKVVAIDTAKGAAVWTGTVRGDARGLAVADGKLFVSTSTGEIACFGATEKAKPARSGSKTVAEAAKLQKSPEFLRIQLRELGFEAASTVRPPVSAAPYPADELASAYAAIAKRIVKGTGITEGYCLDFGAGDGRLAYELAKRTKLNIYCIEPDASRVTAARKALDAAGLYGVRVTVDQGSLDELPYASYFADLVISETAEKVARSLREREPRLAERDGYFARSAKELYRTLRPCGGVAYLAPVAGAKGHPTKRIESWLREGGVPKNEIRASDAAVRVVRGPLPGAGDWTHQYADAGRSGCASDRLVKWPLEMLWFGGPGPFRVMNRNVGPAGPVAANGRLFLAGTHHVIAVNAYNGRELWVRRLSGVGRPWVVWATSNIAADADSLYVVLNDACLRLDATSGKDMRTYRLPLDEPTPEKQNAHVWVYVARWGDLLLGSFRRKSDEEHSSRCVFALDRDSGQVRWMHRPPRTIPHNAIAISDGRLFLIQRTGATERDRRRGQPASEKLTLVAVDVRTGRELWKTGETLDRQDALLAARGVVLATGSGLYTRRTEGPTSVLSAYSASDGKHLWSRSASLYRTPVVVGDTIYERRFAYDLRTGTPKTRRHPLTGEEVPWGFRKSHGCGVISASGSMLCFRSGTAGFYDLAADSGVLSYGGIRPGCAVNMIAAGGVMLIPEGSAGCTCGLNYQTSLALVPAENRNDNWSMFTETGGAGPVKRLALNLGAPGDRRDSEGNLWLGFPRPSTRRALKVEASVDVLPGLGYFRRNPEGPALAGGTRPWIYASGCRGITSINLRVDLTPRVVSLPCQQPPKIDGVLLDPCWGGKSPVGFVEDDAESEPGKANVFARHDADNVYLAFRREPKRFDFDERAMKALGLKDGILGGWTRNTKGHDAPVWRDDSWELFLSDEGRAACVHLGVSASGARYDARFVYGEDDTEDTTWNGEWTSAVAAGKKEWTLELAVSWRTLAEAGLKKEQLAINVRGMSELAIPSFTHTLALRPPGLRGWDPCERFAPVSFGEPAAKPPMAYTVRLHFAEPDDIKPGHRVFDVRIQGATVLEDFDVVREAGGRNMALVREFRDIMAGDTVKIDLVQTAAAAEIKATTAPLLSGVEVLMQQE